MNKWTVSLAILLVSAAANAESVYQCKKDGKTLFSASPTGGDCQLLELKTAEPSAEERQRLQQEQANKAAQRQAEEGTAREERKVRAEEAAARAAEAAARAEERQARAAEAQARYQRELLKAQEEEERNRSSIPPVIFFAPGMPQQTIPRTPSTGVNIQIGGGRSSITTTTTTTGNPAQPSNTIPLTAPSKKSGQP